MSKFIGIFTVAIDGAIISLIINFRKNFLCLDIILFYYKQENGYKYIIFTKFINNKYIHRKIQQHYLLKTDINIIRIVF